MHEIHRIMRVLDRADRRTFNDVVGEGQRIWRALRRRPYEEFSQAIDLPLQIPQAIVELTIENFPAYVPNEVREKVRRTHPAPIIAMGVLHDARAFVVGGGYKWRFSHQNYYGGSLSRHAHGRKAYGH